MAAQQEAAMRACLAQQAHVSPADLAYEEGKYAQAALDLAPEAVQACAYDRYHFGRPGTGRIAIGVYWAFLHRWLQVWHVCVYARVYVAMHCFILFHDGSLFLEP